MCQWNEQNRNAKNNVTVAEDTSGEAFKEIESEKATALDPSGLVDAADDWLFPHVGFDGLDALDEFIEEVETAISCLTNGEAHSQHSHTERKLKEEESEEEENTVEGGCATSLSSQDCLQYGRGLRIRRWMKEEHLQSREVPKPLIQ